MNKKQQEASLLKKFIQAMSLVPEDATRVLRAPNGKLHTYERNESLHQAQLNRMRHGNSTI